VFDLVDMDDDARRELLALPEGALADVARACNRYPDIQLSFERADGGGPVEAGDQVALQARGPGGWGVVWAVARLFCGVFAGRRSRSRTHSPPRSRLTLSSPGIKPHPNLYNPPKPPTTLKNNYKKIQKYKNKQVSLERELEGELGPALAPRFPGRREEAWWLVVGDVAANTLLGIKRVALGKAARVKLEFAAPATPGAHALTLFFMCDSYLGCDQEYELPLAVTAPAGGSGSDSEGGSEGGEAMEAD